MSWTPGPGEIAAIVAKKTVLACGGLGQIFLHTTNQPGSVGHGVAMAYRVGARLIDLEYVQFHPTVFAKKNAPRFLISEAVRGEGAVLVNARGERFMDARAPAGLARAARRRGAGDPARAGVERRALRLPRPVGDAARVRPRAVPEHPRALPGPRRGHRARAGPRRAGGPLRLRRACTPT